MKATATVTANTAKADMGGMVMATVTVNMAMASMAMVMEAKTAAMKKKKTGSDKLHESIN